MLTQIQKDGNGAIMQQSAVDQGPRRIQAAKPAPKLLGDDYSLGVDIQCDANGCQGQGQARATLAMLQEQINRLAQAGGFMPVAVNGVISDTTALAARRAAQVALSRLGANASNEMQNLARGAYDKQQIALHAPTLNDDFMSAASAMRGGHDRGLALAGAGQFGSQFGAPKKQISVGAAVGLGVGLLALGIAGTFFVMRANH